MTSSLAYPVYVVPVTVHYESNYLTVTAKNYDWPIVGDWNEHGYGRLSRVAYPGVGSSIYGVCVCVCVYVSVHVILKNRFEAILNARTALYVTTIHLT